MSVKGLEKFLIKLKSYVCVFPCTHSYVLTFMLSFLDLFNLTLPFLLQKPLLLFVIIIKNSPFTFYQLFNETAESNLSGEETQIRY